MNCISFFFAAIKILLEHIRNVKLCELSAHYVQSIQSKSSIESLHKRFIVANRYESIFKLCDQQAFPYAFYESYRTLG